MKIIETHIVPALHEKIRVQEYAPKVFKTIGTRSGIKKAIKRNEILIDKKVAKTSDWIKEGQKVELLASEATKKPIFRLKLKVVFEDDHLALVEKPTGYPTRGNYFRTIENALPFNLSDSIKPDALPYPSPVHRLDTPTSGLLLIAKTRGALVKLNQEFEAKAIQKKYRSIVHGSTPNWLTCTAEINEKQAHTKVKTVEHFQKGKDYFSLVQASPKTGRTHQIRIHLAKSGFPILGDTLYGKTSENISVKNLFLCAVELQFIHPITDEKLYFKISTPCYFDKFTTSNIFCT